MSNNFLPFHINWSWSHIEICSSTYRLKFQLLSWQLWVSQDSKVYLRVSLFLSHILPTSWKGFPSASYLSNGTSCTLLGPNLMDFTSLPAHEIKYSNEPVTSYSRNQGAPHYKACHVGSPHAVLPGVGCLFPLSYEYMWRTYISQSHVWMLGIMWSVIF